MLNAQQVLIIEPDKLSFHIQLFFRKALRISEGFFL